MFCFFPEIPQPGQPNLAQQGILENTAFSPNWDRNGKPNLTQPNCVLAPVWRINFN